MKGAFRFAAFLLGLFPAVAWPQPAAELVADVCPGECSSFPYYGSGQSAAGATRFYFVGEDPVEGPQPYVTDADTPGARRLATIRPLSYYRELSGLTTVGDTLFFSALTPAGDGWSETSRLWRSDGTPAGTRPVEFPPGSRPPIGDGIRRVAGGVLVWSTQGVWWVSESGSVVRKVADDALIRVTEAPGVAYFLTGGCAVNCFESKTAAVLRKIDATGSVTTLVELTLSIFYGEGPIVAMAASPAGVFYVANTPEIWFANGLAPPTKVITLKQNATLYEYGRTRTGNLIFRVFDNAASSQFWTSDGTPQGTGPLTFFSRLSVNRPMTLVGHANGRLVVNVPQDFVASAYPDAPSYPLNSDLWVLDPTAPLGARQLRSIAQRDWVYQAYSPLPDERGVFFLATVPGPGGSEQYTVWHTDGTTGGTQPLDPKTFDGFDFWEYLGSVQGSLYFTGVRKGVGQELFRLRLAAHDPPAYATVEVTEYHHAVLNHYFMTADPAEKAKLDGGSIAGWTRTGFGFIAYAPGSGAANTSPVCRFYGRPEAGLDSHFYSASQQECADVEAKFGHAWIKESADVFEVVKPDPATGVCTANATPLYRAYNQRADVNHRYSLHAVDQKAMEAKAWRPEGITSAGIAMCVPAPIRP